MKNTIENDIQIKRPVRCYDCGYVTDNPHKEGWKQIGVYWLCDVCGEQLNKIEDS